MLVSKLFITTAVMVSYMSVAVWATLCWDADANVGYCDEPDYDDPCSDGRLTTDFSGNCEEDVRNSWLSTDFDQFDCCVEHDDPIPDPLPENGTGYKCVNMIGGACGQFGAYGAVYSACCDGDAAVLYCGITVNGGLRLTTAQCTNYGCAQSQAFQGGISAKCY